MSNCVLCDAPVYRFEDRVWWNDKVNPRSSWNWRFPQMAHADCYAAEALILGGIPQPDGQAEGVHYFKPHEEPKP